MIRHRPTRTLPRHVPKNVVPWPLPWSRDESQAQEARAKVIEQTEVPIAMAEAFRNGNLGIMDYYRMENIKADTDMRDSIAKPQDGGGNKK